MSYGFRKAIAFFMEKNVHLVNVWGTGRVAEGKDFWPRSGQKDQALAGPGSADRRRKAEGTPWASFVKNLCSF